MPAPGEASRACILIVDDDAGAVRVLANLLRDLARILVTTRGSEAMALARSARPDLVLLDLAMPDADGLTLCRDLRADSETGDALVLFVTGHGDAQAETQALAAGAIDFIHKPVHPEIVRARVANYLALKRQADHLRRLTMLDGLTGVANRRAFDVGLAREWARAGRSGEPVALLMADIDHFKQFNDLYGHQAGDVCLRDVAAAIATHARRPGDLIARYGGEEFALLLPACSVATAREIAGQVLTDVASLRITHAGSPTAPWITISLGVASMVAPHPEAGVEVGPWAGDAGQAGGGPEALVGAADAALYRAKRAGRNRVEVAAA